MYHRVLNRSLQLQIFVAAMVAVMLVIVAAFVATTTTVPATKTIPVLPSEPSRPISPTTISESEATRIVWSLPEVQAAADQLRSRGSRPITYVTSHLPSESGNRQASYVVKFAEDRDGQATTVYTFEVDAYTGQVSVYDVVEDTTISLEQWRARRQQ